MSAKEMLSGAVKIENTLIDKRTYGPITDAARNLVNELCRIVDGREA